MEVRDIFDELSGALHKLERDGGGVNVGLSGVRPRYLIHNYHPLVYEKYGLIRNRAPILTGRFALRGFLTAYDEEYANELRAFSVVDSGSAMYGCRTTAQFINELLVDFDLPYRVQDTEL